MDGSDVVDAMRVLLPDLHDDDELRARLRRLHDDAIRAHPSVAVDARAWGAALGRALVGESSAEVRGRMDALPAADLWLAAAAAQGVPAAIETFEHTLMPQVDRALRRLVSSMDETQELRQRVRVHLLVAEPPALPRIGQYRGRGSLAGWVRTVAGRLALNARRDAPRYVDGEVDLPERLLASTPELTHLREEYREVFARAFREAFTGLPPRSRNLLRLRHGEEMPLDALAQAYQVHVSTTSRWLTAAREALLRRFTESAGAHLGDAVAVQELLHLVQSRFEGSLRVLLASRVLDGPTTDEPV